MRILSGFFFFFILLNLNRGESQNLKQAVDSILQLYEIRKDESNETLRESLKTLGPHAIGVLIECIQTGAFQKSISALELLTLTYPDEHYLSQLLPLLRHSDWRIQVSILEVFKRKKFSDALHALVETMDREDGRVLNDTVDTLRAITGKNFGADSLEWRRYVSGNWSESEWKGKSIPLYFDLEVYSKRVLFILDLSYSMSWGNRRQLAEHNLIQTLQRLPKDVKFNLIVYGLKAHLWRKNLVPVTPQNVEKAVLFLKRLKLQPATNSYDALALGLQQTEVDTLFFLSDGYPTAGAFVQTDLLLREISKQNRSKKIRINTIGIFQGGPPQGYEDSEPDKAILKEFMKKLAEENSGTYHFIR